MSGAQALLRFSRDRRGYEHFCLVQPDRHGKGPGRILYLFRSPPGIKVGRAPFDDEMKRKIEAQNPGVSFDWPKLLATAIPPPTAEPERWRERRQVERAEKAARAARRADLGVDEVEAPREDGTGEGTAEGTGEATQEATGEATDEATREGGVSGDITRQEAAVPVSSQGSETRPAHRRRRRRRGRRRHGHAATPSGEQTPPPADPEASNE
jgi:hypothetical protein